jgi:hypothetical protein
MTARTSSTFARIGFGLLISAMAGNAMAHTEVGVAGGLISGFLHPIYGLDHLVAMVAVGLWGRRLDRNYRCGVTCHRNRYRSFGTGAGYYGGFQSKTTDRNRSSDSGILCHISRLCSWCRATRGGQSVILRRWLCGFYRPVTSCRHCAGRANTLAHWHSCSTHHGRHNCSAGCLLFSSKPRLILITGDPS